MEIPRICRVTALTAAMLATSLVPYAPPANAAVTQPLTNFIWSQVNPVLSDATQVTLSGAMTDGGCSFVTPKLKLAPDQDAVEADQIAVDNTTCTAIWQIGTPAAVVPTANVDAGAELVGPSVDTGAACDGCTSAATSLKSASGYEKGWVTDPPGITLASTQSTLSWAYNGNCVRSGSGAYHYYWHSSTGWSAPKNKFSYIYYGCGDDEVTSGADFEDQDFWTDPCWPLDTWIHFHYINVYGWYDGSLSGDYSISYANSCVTLYIHHQLTRQTG